MTPRHYDTAAMRRDMLTAIDAGMDAAMTQAPSEKARLGLRISQRFYHGMVDALLLPFDLQNEGVDADMIARTSAGASSAFNIKLLECAAGMGKGDVYWEWVQFTFDEIIKSQTSEKTSAILATASFEKTFTEGGNA